MQLMFFVLCSSYFIIVNAEINNYNISLNNSDWLETNITNGRFISERNNGFLKFNESNVNERRQYHFDYYFAYGIDLYYTWFRVKSPNALYVGIAMVNGYRLDFITYSPEWRGSLATLVKETGSIVYGVLWNIPVNEWVTMDKAEEGNNNHRENIEVYLLNAERVYVSYTYESNEEAVKLLKDERVPMDRRPSDTYLQVIIKGAINCLLPQQYIRYLYTYKTTGEYATREIRKRLGYPFIALNDTLD